MIGSVVLGVMLLTQAPDASVLAEVQRSHIDANVPAAAEFTSLLQRDLEAYFNSTHQRDIRVEHELLRDGPTQSGVAYPKFYAWVRVLQAGTVVKQGAARLAAIERTRFDVTSFVPDSAIRADPKALSSVFPEAVCEKIKAKLRITS
jgi:hypothetical protein